MSDRSTSVPPGTPPPSPPPGGPTGPTPTGPGPGRLGDDFFDAVDEIYADFALPDTRVPLVFDEGEHRLVGAVRLSDPPDPKPIPNPHPYPPPLQVGVGAQYDALPRWQR